MKNPKLSNLAKADFVHEINRAINVVSQLKNLSHVHILGTNFAVSTNSVYVIAHDVNNDLFKSIRISDHHLDNSSIDLNDNFTTIKVTQALTRKLSEPEDWFKLDDGFRLWYAKTTLDEQYSYVYAQNNWWHINHLSLSPVEKGYLEFALSHNLLQTYYDSDKNRDVTYLSDAFQSFRNTICAKFKNVDIIKHKGINVQPVVEPQTEILARILLDDNTVADFWLKTDDDMINLSKFSHVLFNYESRHYSGVVLMIKKMTETVATMHYKQAFIETIIAKPICKKICVKMPDGQIVDDIFVSHRKYHQFNVGYFVNFKNIHTQQEYKQAKVLSLRECTANEIQQFDDKTFNYAVYQVTGRLTATHTLANVVTNNGVIIENVDVPSHLADDVKSGTKIKLDDDVIAYVINVLKIDDTTFHHISPEFSVIDVISEEMVTDENKRHVKVTVMAIKKKLKESTIDLMNMSDHQRAKMMEKVVQRVIKLPKIATKFKLHNLYRTKPDGGQTILNLVMINSRAHSVIVLAIQPKTVYVTNSFTYGQITTSEKLVLDLCNAILSRKNRIIFTRDMRDKLQHEKIVYRVSKVTKPNKLFKNDMNFVYRLKSARLLTRSKDHDVGTKTYVVGVRLQRILDKFE